MTLSEKTAYLKGLCEGMELDGAKNETKLIKKLIEVLDEAALTIADLEDRVDELEEYVDELDEDLGEVEEIVYNDECLPPPEHMHHCECGCDECEDDFDDEDYDDCDDIIEVECPSCEETICLPTSIDLAHVICPACGEEFSCICDCDDCDCEECDCEDCDCEDEGK